MKLAVIPARGGSKRIPRKNIKNFCGKPIISYSILAAIESNLFDRVLVSTDDEEIAAVSREYGADVPFVRPPDLANDHAGTLPVIHHAIDTLKNMGEQYEHVCCLYATAPFVNPSDLTRGFEILKTSGAEYAITTTSFAYPIQRALKFTLSGRIAMFQPENYYKRSQDLEHAYHDAGQFYWGKASAYLQRLPFFAEHSVPVLLPRQRVQDIDTLEDWERAELMHKAWNAMADHDLLTGKVGD
jgi:N-acylneuraminate cytidylyltransferase